MDPLRKQKSYTAIQMGVVVDPATVAMLHSAAANGKVNACKRLLKKVPVNTPAEDGTTAIHVAARGGHAAVVKLLIEKKAVVNVADIDGVTPLHYAARITDEDTSVAVVECLLGAGAHVGCVDSTGITPIHVAAHAGVCGTLALLIQAPNAPTEHYDNTGLTPLHHAAFAGGSGAVHTLLSAGCSPNVATHTGDTPLHYAARVGDGESVRLLLGCGAVLAYGEDGRTPLHDAASHDQSEIVRMLVRDWGVAADVACNATSATALHLACMVGSVNSVRLLLECGASTHHRDTNGRTPLHDACACGSLHCVKLLLGFGNIDVNACAVGGETPLHAAVRSGNEEVVECLLDAGADCYAEAGADGLPLHLACLHGFEPVACCLLDKGGRNQVDCVAGETEYRPLHHAAINNAHSIIELLLSRGAAVNAEGNDGCTALHMAAQAGHIEAAMALVEGGADINMPSEIGTPLATAAADGHATLVHCLLECGARLHACDGLGNTALHHAAFHDQSDCIDLLLDTDERGGGLIHLQNGDHMTAVQVAVSGGALRATELLLTRGASTDGPPPEGGTLLHAAVKAETPHHDMPALLVRLGIDVNAVDSFGQSPLHAAAALHSANAMVQTLLDLGADPSIADSSGNTPLHHAVATQALHAVHTLLSTPGIVADAPNCHRRSVLHIACHLGHVEALELLLQAGVDVHAVDENGLMPLHIAAQERREDVIQTLLGGGATLDVSDMSASGGLTPLHHALAHGHGGIARVFLRAKASVRAVDNEGNAALHHAARGGDPEAVEAVLRAGGDVDALNAWGESALHVAVKCQHADAVRVLVGAGASTSATNSDGETPGDVARALVTARDGSGDRELVEIVNDMLVELGEELVASPRSSRKTLRHSRSSVRGSASIQF